MPSGTGPASSGGAGDDELADTLLGGALEELDVALEELRVTEEEVRTRQEALDAGGRANETERERYQALFVLAPAAYLVTDPAGLIREANLRAVALLGDRPPVRVRQAAGVLCRRRRPDAVPGPPHPPGP